MKTAKLVTGILSIIISVFIMLQSCAAGLGNALAENGENSGSAGLIVAVLVLTGGIVMVATRKSEKRGGSIACAIIYLLAALLGFPNAGSYGDLKIWSGMAVILGVMNIIAARGSNKNNNEV